MLHVPLACDLGQVVPQLAYLRAVQAIVDLPLRVSRAFVEGGAGLSVRGLKLSRCMAMHGLLGVLYALIWLAGAGRLPACPQKAAALDPHNVAAQLGPEGEAAAQRRDEACYQHTMAVLRLLIDRSGLWGLSARRFTGTCNGGS